MLTDEEREYLLLIAANGSIAFVPAQDAALGRLLELGLLESEPDEEDHFIVRLSEGGRKLAASLARP